MINRCERDELFMSYMSGQKQVIMTAEMFGTQWKVKIDSYHPGVAIVDLKTCQSITKTFWHGDAGYMNFLAEWGYYIQGAVYQRVVEIKSLPSRERGLKFSKISRLHPAASGRSLRGSVD